MSLVALLDEHPIAPDEPLLFGPDATLTLRETRARVAAIADELAARGVEPRGAVAVRLPNGAELVATMFAVWTVGAVLVPVNPRATEREVATIVAQLDPQAVVDAEGSTARTAVARLADGVAFVTWTSGTTGVPKPILHTHDGYLELLDRVLGPLRAGGGDRATRPPTPNLIPVSLALNAGIYNALFGLRAGSPLVIMDRFEPGTFAALVARHEIRSTVLPPAAIAMLAADPELDTLAPLRYVRSITAPLSPLVAQRFTQRFGVTVLNGYGQAEVGEVIGWTAADARAHPEKVGAVGRPHPGVELRLVDGHGAPVGVDEPGELLVRPPARAVGYADGDELEDRVDADGFVRTGDVARFDADGFVWIEGRLGDVINRGGNKVHPEQVEEVLSLVPGVREVAVVGAPDERLGEVPVAYVVGDATDEELLATCREHLVAYKVPVAFVRIDELPRTEVGKVRRAALAARSRPSGAPSR